MDDEGVGAAQLHQTSSEAAMATEPTSPPSGDAGGSMAEVDAIIDKLLTVRGARPGKQVQLAESEIRMLCVR